MDRPMRMIVIAGVLMLALLVAIVGAVSVDSMKWEASLEKKVQGHASHQLFEQASQQI